MKKAVFKFTRDIKIVPLHDLHIGSNHFDEASFLQTLDYIKKNKRVYFTIDGDVIENITPSDKINPYGQKSQPADQITQLMEYLKPIKHRCLGVIDGNHAQRTKKKAYLDILVGVARELEVPYLDVGGYMKFYIGNQIYTIAMQHGASGGSNPETELKRLQAVYSKAEIFLLGHDHNLFFRRKPFLDIDKNDNEILSLKYYCRTGSYLTYPDYARDRMYEPKIVGSLSIHLFDKEHKVSCIELAYVNSKALWK